MSTIAMYSPTISLEDAISRRLDMRSCPGSEGWLIEEGVLSRYGEDSPIKNHPQRSMRKFRNYSGTVHPVPGGDDRKGQSNRLQDKTHSMFMDNSI